MSPISNPSRFESANPHPSGPYAISRRSRTSICDWKISDW